MSSPAPSNPSVSDGLDLESLDADSLFTALTNVEKAIPELLLSVKPVLSHLVSSTSPNGQQHDEETSGMLAREGVERYMSLLDKIQFILRQSVYYLRETKVHPSTLRPPAPNNIPTPFASTIPSQSLAGGEAELGLYASRLEARVLGELGDALSALKEEERAPQDDQQGHDGDQSMEVDHAER